MNDMSALDAVRPRKPRPSPGRSGKGGAPAKTAASFGVRFRRFRSRATLVIASAGFSAIMVGIVCNAVLFQKGHHPAPLFGTAADAPVPAPAAERVAPATAAPPLAAAAPVDAPPMPAAPAATAAAAPVHHAVHATTPSHHGGVPKVDGIARLIGAESGAAPAHHGASHVRPGQGTGTRAGVPASTVRKARPVVAAKDHAAATGTATN